MGRGCHLENSWVRRKILCRRKKEKKIIHLVK